ncbi:hypothetical protein NQT62_14130 [Limnobacter humi]|uniref:Type 4 secretion system PilS N-terminal domain-containing protein n=1 Tax=Limnobacter humi TaxID=1778671 RepID=A0ABT1WKC1_9BURK|nr:hypothetical protein [Limnobacter humi]MCQ8897576.1 hypothetical protein [Limnobacter humi]
MNTQTRRNKPAWPRRHHQFGFIQAALLFGIALMTAILGGFALANRSPTSQTDVEQAKVNASVILKQASDLRDGVSRFASDFGASAVLNTLDFSATASQGLFDPTARYALPQIMPTSAFNATVANAAPSANQAGHWFYNRGTPGKGIGSGSADPLVFLPSVRQDVCERVNRLLYGGPGIPVATAALSTWQTIGGDGGLSGATGTDPTGWPEGCVQTSDNSYLYFKVVQEN